MLYVDKIIVFIGWLDFNVNHKMAPLSSKYQVTVISKKKDEKGALSNFYKWEIREPPEDCNVKISRRTAWNWNSTFFLDAWNLKRTHSVKAEAFAPLFTHNKTRTALYFGFEWYSTQMFQVLMQILAQGSCCCCQYNMFFLAFEICWCSYFGQIKRTLQKFILSFLLLEQKDVIF